ncbi:MAG: hypothetical protein ABIX12_07545 [Rubrivivax sp.]
MFNLIFYGILAVAALAAVAAANNVIKHHYIDPVIAEYEPKLKNANDRAADAENANTQLRASVQLVSGEVKVCTDNTRDLKDKGDVATTKARVALAAATERANAAAAELKELRRKAGGPPTVGDACAQADAILTDLSRDIRSILGLSTGPKTSVDVRIK